MAPTSPLSAVRDEIHINTVKGCYTIFKRDAGATTYIGRESQNLDSSTIGGLNSRAMDTCAVKAVLKSTAVVVSPRTNNEIALSINDQHGRATAIQTDSITES